METKVEEQAMDGSFWSEVGESLRTAWNRAGLPTVLAAGAIFGGMGCSPQSKSYMFDSFTELPAPPENARLQIGVSTEEDGTIFINYIIWNADKAEFVRRDIHYTSKKVLGMVNAGDFRQKGGYEQRILDGEVLSSGAIVDQERGVITLPSGLLVDGKSGSVMDAQGNVIKTLEKVTTAE